MAAVSAASSPSASPISTRVASNPTATTAQMTTMTVQAAFHSRALPPMVIDRGPPLRPRRRRQRAEGRRHRWRRGDRGGCGSRAAGAGRGIAERRRGDERAGRCGISKGGRDGCGGRSGGPGTAAARRRRRLDVAAPPSFTPRHAPGGAPTSARRRGQDGGSRRGGRGSRRGGAREPARRPLRAPRAATTAESRSAELARAPGPRGRAPSRRSATTARPGRWPRRSSAACPQAGHAVPLAQSSKVNWARQWGQPSSRAIVALQLSYARLHG